MYFRIQIKMFYMQVCSTVLSFEICIHSIQYSNLCISIVIGLISYEPKQIWTEKKTQNFQTMLEYREEQFWHFWYILSSAHYNRDNHETLLARPEAAGWDQNISFESTTLMITSWNMSYNILSIYIHNLQSNLNLNLMKT